MTAVNFRRYNVYLLVGALVKQEGPLRSKSPPNGGENDDEIAY